MGEKLADRLLRAAAEGDERFAPYVAWVRSEGVTDDEFRDIAEKVLAARPVSAGTA